MIVCLYSSMAEHKTVNFGIKVRFLVETPNFRKIVKDDLTNLGYCGMV